MSVDSPDNAEFRKIITDRLKDSVIGFDFSRLPTAFRLTVERAILQLATSLVDNKPSMKKAEAVELMATKYAEQLRKIQFMGWQVGKDDLRNVGRQCAMSKLSRKPGSGYFLHDPEREPASASYAYMTAVSRAEIEVKTTNSVAVDSSD
jgi:hypothetical protein